MIVFLSTLSLRVEFKESSTAAACLKRSPICDFGVLPTYSSLLGFSPNAAVLWENWRLRPIFFESEQFWLFDFDSYSFDKRNPLAMFWTLLPDLSVKWIFSDKMLPRLPFGVFGVYSGDLYTFSVIVSVLLDICRGSTLFSSNMVL